MQPLLSVIMPVYNAEKHLLFAINSILAQTFTQFEFIIIDDGSTDQSSTIIHSFTDSRIIYQKNEKNIGLAHTLNKGIDEAKGQLIARMDADDIALPERLAKQVHFLNAHQQVDVIDCVMEYINENGDTIHQTNSNKLSYWQIKQQLPKENCLGHSSIMIRTEALKKYKYKNVGNEDYELWLRMMADGIIIEKLPEVLLQYRIHQGSYTYTAHANGTQFFRQAQSKKLFLSNEWGTKKKYTFFSFKVFYYMVVDYITAYYKRLKIVLHFNN
jgi:glycosyltransferase involved in cell wall biosynthesis